MEDCLPPFLLCLLLITATTPTPAATNTIVRMSPSSTRLGAACVVGPMELTFVGTICDIDFSRVIDEEEEFRD
jgi:hypothetical protein